MSRHHDSDDIDFTSSSSIFDPTDAALDAVTEPADVSPSGYDADIDDDDEDAEDADEIIIFDADADDDQAEAAAAVMEAARATTVDDVPEDDFAAPLEGTQHTLPELMAMIEALIFVSEEPLPTKTLAEVLGEDRDTTQMAVEGLAKELDERGSGLMLREIAGGWQLTTRPEHHEHIRQFLKAQPSAKLSLPALETLAVIAYKQPVTVPEILDIRGVQSTSAIKTLLDKRLIVSKGRKEAVGRPMMYGTSKEFLMQFGLRDLSELPSVEDFEDLTSGAAA